MFEVTDTLMVLRLEVCSQASEFSVQHLAHSFYARWGLHTSSAGSVASITWLQLMNQGPKYTEQCLAQWKP